jgi:hypothetical protein
MGRPQVQSSAKADIECSPAAAGTDAFDPKPQHAAMQRCGCYRGTSGRSAKVTAPSALSRLIAGVLLPNFLALTDLGLFPDDAQPLFGHRACDGRRLFRPRRIVR